MSKPSRFPPIAASPYRAYHRSCLHPEHREIWSCPKRFVSAKHSNEMLETSAGITSGRPRCRQIRSGKRVMKLSRLGIFTFGRVCAFIVSFSPMSLLRASR